MVKNPLTQTFQVAVDRAIVVKREATASRSQSAVVGGIMPIVVKREATASRSWGSVTKRDVLIVVKREATASLITIDYK